MSSRIIITIVIVILTRPSRQGAISPPHLTWRPRPIHIEGAVCSAPLSVPCGLHSTLCTHVEGPILKMQNVLYFDQTMVSSLAKGTTHIKDAVCSACTPIYSIYNVLQWRTPIQYVPAFYRAGQEQKDERWGTYRTYHESIPSPIRVNSSTIAIALSATYMLEVNN